MLNSKGYIHIYTGNGKGKTTAAIGLAIRALGAGFKVFLGQFLKSGEYSEIKALHKFEPNIQIYQFGKGCFIRKKPSLEDYESAKKGWEICLKAIYSKKFDLLIFDELNLALYFGLLDKKEIIKVLKDKPPQIEIVITGRYAPEELIELADLVTEMKEIKHYYKKGVIARIGIEK